MPIIMQLGISTLPILNRFFSTGLSQRMILILRKNPTLRNTGTLPLFQKSKPRILLESATQFSRLREGNSLRPSDIDDWLTVARSTVLYMMVHRVRVAQHNMFQRTFQARMKPKRKFQLKNSPGRFVRPLVPSWTLPHRWLSHHHPQNRRKRPHCDLLARITLLRRLGPSRILKVSLHRALVGHAVHYRALPEALSCVSNRTVAVVCRIPLAVSLQLLPKRNLGALRV